MSTTSIGRSAEQTAQRWLRNEGFEIIDTNWRTRWCEIDIIASKNKVMYFVEVRYRKSTAWGDGLESITAKKRKQMEFAAQFWISLHNWQGDAQIVAIAVSGNPPEVTAYSEL